MKQPALPPRLGTEGQDQSNQLLGNSQINQFFCRSVFTCQAMEIISTMLCHFAFQVLLELARICGVPASPDGLIQTEQFKRTEKINLE